MLQTKPVYMYVYCWPDPQEKTVFYHLPTITDTHTDITQFESEIFTVYSYTSASCCEHTHCTPGAARLL